MTLSYRQEGVRLVLELRDSSDPSLRDAKAPVYTGCKWRAEEVISRLRHDKIVGKIIIRESWSRMEDSAQVLV